MLNRNYSEIRKVVQENISKDGLNEYYINNSWSVPEYAYKEEPNLHNNKSMEDFIFIKSPFLLYQTMK